MPPMTGIAPDEAVPGWRDILSRDYAPATLLVCLGIWLHAADSLIVATMLPAMIAEIGGSELVSWTVVLYELGTLIVGVASGTLAIRHGVRVPMGCAAALFAFGCGLAAVAPAMWVVLVGRLVQGLGGGGLMALAFVTVSVLFPPRLVPRAIAAVSATWGASAFLGPLIGGLFVEYATWRAGFWFFAAQAGIMALWIGLGLKVDEVPRDGNRPAGLFLRRLALLSAGVVCVALAGVAVEAVRTVLLVAAGLVCLAVFLRMDANAGANRLLPRRVTDIRTGPGAAFAMITAFAVATIAFAVYGPLLLVTIYGVSPLVAGYLIALESIGWTLAALAVAGFGERTDLKFIALGMGVIALSVVAFVVVLPYGGIWLVGAVAVIEGAGFGMAWSFLLRQTTALAAAGDVERIAGGIPTVQWLGYALGAAYAGIVANTFGFAVALEAGDVRDAATAIFAACVPFAVLGLVALVFFTRAVRAARRAEPPSATPV